ncbi:MAG: hypothetical protein OFPI_17670 [Osedax symbiont Rs2]|nr:MAG: hypothetical protein OFPI_17670 [Osedax symbiont Rs2]
MHKENNNGKSTAYEAGCWLLCSAIRGLDESESISFDVLRWQCMGIGKAVTVGWL